MTSSVPQTGLPINVDALAEIIVDHLSEPTYCLDDEGEGFIRFHTGPLFADEATGDNQCGDTVHVNLTAENGQTFELVLRQTS